MKRLLLVLAAIGMAVPALAGGGYVSGQQVSPSQGGTGTSTVFTQGSVIFSGANGVYTQNNAQCFWDNTNNRLGIGTANPATILHLSSGTVTIDGTSPGLNIGAGSPGANALLAMQNTSGTTYLDVQRDSAGTGESMVVFGDNTTRRWYMGQRNTGQANFHLYSSGISDDAMQVRLSNGFVGIGPPAGTQPATKLHLSSGTFTIDGNVQLAVNLGGTARLWSRTMAQIDTLVPGAVGEEVFCSNCTTPDVCVSTGTSASQFRRIGTTSGCGSGN